MRWGRGLAVAGAMAAADGIACGVVAGVFSNLFSSPLPFVQLLVVWVVMTIGVLIPSLVVVLPVFAWLERRRRLNIWSALVTGLVLGSGMVVVSTMLWGGMPIGPGNVALAFGRTLAITVPEVLAGWAVWVWVGPKAPGIDRVF